MKFLTIMLVFFCLLLNVLDAKSEQEPAIRCNGNPVDRESKNDENDELRFVCHSQDRVETPVDQLPANAAKWFTGLLAAYNTGDVASVKQFIGNDENFVGFVMSLYKEYGPLTRRLRFEGAEWCQGDITKGWVGFVIDRTRSNNRFNIRGVRRGISPPGAAEFTIKANNLPRYLHSYLQKSADCGHFSGSVLVAHDGVILFEDAFGFADIKNKIKLTKNTRFWLASLSKPFIGVAIAQLAQSGKLKFDDPLSKFVPEYPKAIGDKVTIHHLLTHTSGIEMDHDRQFMQAVSNSESMDQILEAHVRFIESIETFDGQNFEPLERFNYTNEGPDLLGLIIERASGQPWETYLLKNIFLPCKMQRTATAKISDPIKNLAKCYTLGGNRLTPVRRELPASARTGTAVAGPARPAGSSLSNVNDMFQFANSIVANKIVDADSWKILTRPHVEELAIGSAKRHYGYLFQHLEQNSVRTIGHSGGAQGMSTIMEIYPEEKYIVIVLSNFDRSSARNVSEHIKELIAIRRPDNHPQPQS